jgi:alpha-glucosidase
VIPMWTEAPRSTDGYHPEALELHVFVPAGDGEHVSMWQEDDGLTFAALDGARYRTTCVVSRAGGQISVRADVTGDGYPEFRRQQFQLVVHGGSPAVVRLDGDEVSRDGSHFVLDNRGADFLLEFSV